MYTILTKEKDLEFQGMINYREVTRKYMRETNRR